MQEKILLIFEESKMFNRADIIDTALFNQYNIIELETVSNLQAGNFIKIGSYKCIIDCTQQNKIYNFVSKQNGTIALVDGVEYVKFGENYITKSFEFQQLFLKNVNTLNEEIAKSFRQRREDLFNKINFMRSFLNIVDMEQFEIGLLDGIQLADITSSSKKQFILVKERPSKTPENVEYIQYRDVPFLHELVEVLKHVK